MVTLQRRLLSSAEAHDVAAWAYPPPFDVYDSPDAALFLRRSPDGEGYYPALDDEGRLVAFAVLGAEARVRGQEPAEGVVDVGLGVRPDLTSCGVGTALLPQVLALVGDLPGATTARAAVAASNDRSLALCRSAGFREIRDFAGPGDRPFRELALSLDAATVRAGCRA